MKPSLYLFLRIILISIFLPYNLWSQQEEIKTPVEPITYLQVRKSKDLSSFTLEIIDDDEFQYRTFLNDSKMSDDTYEVGDEKYSKKELTKLLRKGGRTSTTVKQFINFLSKENFTLSKELSRFELELLFDKFRDGTLDEYLDELPSVFSY